MPEAAVLLGIITLGAAIVNGGLGYGFSSLTVPLALLFMTNRVLNPALVLLEVPLNGYVLFVNRHSITDVWRRVLPVVIALGPGIAIGTSVVASVSTAWVKIGTYVVLLPLILAQAAGYRRPVQSQRIAGLVFGGCLGVLYSVTTISGPPLAIALSNQGLAKQDFRAALGVIRLAESSLTAVAYLYAGMITPGSVALVPYMLPSVLIGVPLGAALVRRVHPETFRRICMSFDAWIVAFGLSALLSELRIVPGPSAYAVLGLVAAIDTWLLYTFFSGHAATWPVAPHSRSPPLS